jgi:hypothetical protein
MKNPLIGRTYTRPQLEKILNNLHLDPKVILPVNANPELFPNDPKHERFTHVKIKLIPSGEDNVKIKISGNYVSSYKAGYQDRAGNWYPSQETKEHFKYTGDL